MRWFKTFNLCALCLLPNNPFILHCKTFKKAGVIWLATIGERWKVKKKKKGGETVK